MAFIFHFEALIAREKIDENALSIGLRKKIANLRKLHQAIADTEKDVKAGGLSVEKKAQLEQKLTDSKAAEPDMDQEIVEGIKKWIPRQEFNKKAGERLKKAQEAKKTKMPTEPLPSPAPEPEPAPTPAPTPTPTPVPAPVVPSTPASTPSDEPEKKKKMAWWGWALMIGGVAVLALVGVQVNRRMAERNAGE